MMRFAAVALLVIGLAIPACAQRGGGGGARGGGGGGFHGGGGGGFHGSGGGGFHGGGGFSGHPAGGFSGPRFSAPRPYGGFAPSRSFRSAPGPRFTRPYMGYRNPRYGSGSRSGYRSGFRAPYQGWRGDRGRGRDGDHDRDDRFRRRFFSNFATPAYIFPDWIGLGPIGCYPDASIYGDDYDEFGCEDQFAPDQSMVYGDDEYGGQGGDQYQNEYQNQPPYGGDEYQNQPPYGGDEYQNQPPPPPPDEPQYRPPAYQPPAQSPRAPRLPASQSATTIVFKDGRPAEQIHNYALTRTTLFVLDPQRHDIPLDQIDLAATERANRASGIEFRVPQTVQ